MVASSFSTVETICPLMVSARAWLFASAVRHHRMWTPIALTMIDARTRPEIVRRMPIRIISVASCCMYRKKPQRCKANVFASATFGQQQGAVGMTAIIEIFVYPLAWPTHVQWAALLLVLLCRGPGKLAIDEWLRRRLFARLGASPVES